jgi:hypothetical protein
MKTTDEDRKTGGRDHTGIPLKFSLLKYFSAFLLSVSILACSHVTPQEKQEGKGSTLVRDCGKNYTEESNLFSGTTYKAWERYDNLDYNKAFDAAVFSIQNNGHGIASHDRGSGTVRGQMVSGTRQQTPDPIDVRIANETSSLVVRLTFKSTAEAKNQAIACRFFDEFERLVKQVPTETPKPIFKPGQSPSIKVQEPGKPGAPVVEAKQKPAPSFASPSPSRTTEIVWASANLREGPGMNYRVIGSAKKGTPLQVYEDKGTWLRVRLDDGKEVWVSKAATPEAPKTPSTPSPSPDPPPSPSSKRALSKPVSPM